MSQSFALGQAHMQLANVCFDKTKSHVYMFRPPSDNSGGGVRPPLLDVLWLSEDGTDTQHNHTIYNTHI